jgi:hypothetical protein
LIDQRRAVTLLVNQRPDCPHVALKGLGCDFAGIAQLFQLFHHRDRIIAQL